jgi:hypothetical protein
MSESRTGKKRAPFSEETKRKMSKAKKGKTTWNKGKHHSEETRKKLSENNFMRRLPSLYKTYKENGGELKWHEFMKNYKDII